MTTDPGDLVLDPTCGSGTTAFVAEQWGRRWITIDTSRVAVALARTRLMAARYPYYLLADSPEGQLKDAEISGRVPTQPLPATLNDIRHGFVYKRVPHITLKSIANNEEIEEIYERFQQELEPLRKKLNELLKKNWEEWEIPRELEEKNPQAAEVHAKWWQLRRERQKEIDASIARRADMELLYDQPCEDNKKVRVSGPFTVESLSPHRVLPSEQERPLSEQAAESQGGTAQFETLILENLRVSGVKGIKKEERLMFTRLEPFASPYLQAMGEYQDEKKNLKRVAVCIGPEHSTVGADLVKEAAKEAVKGQGVDLLVVLGFAFDPHVSEEVKEWGNLTILPARINPELQMHGNLLKKSGAANLFMAFGEPDMTVEKNKDGKYTVTIKGVDVYDPNTGEIRSSSTDEIACWFIDTAYNGESFFVRHAYFTGGNDPYDKLRRALRAEIDEAAWSALYATSSHPFEKPEKGKIAVKVINHYGDEVMKVVEIK
jgi:adenine-specific DNA-methyltransferase